MPEFQAELAEKGFVVIKVAIPRDRALQDQKKAEEWIKSFSDELDYAKPETWIAQNLPLTNGIKTYAHYCLPHEKFVWDARQEPGVVDTFAKLWGTDELLIFPRRASWEHIDQGPLRRGVHCFQGILNLSPSGPEDGGLVAFPGSQELNDEYFDSRSEVERNRWLPFEDVYQSKPEELDWFKSHGSHPHKVCADVGDPILWDSRVIHYGSEPTEKSNQIRIVIYTTYTPSKLATPENIDLKMQAFKSYSSTTHWPHQYIIPRGNTAYLPDGTPDPRNRKEPLEKPEMTNKLLKLTGMKSYRLEERDL